MEVEAVVTCKNDTVSKCFIDTSVFSHKQIKPHGLNDFDTTSIFHIFYSNH